MSREEEDLMAEVLWKHTRIGGGGSGENEKNGRLFGETMNVFQPFL